MTDLKKIFYYGILMACASTVQAQKSRPVYVTITGVELLPKDSSLAICVKDITIKGCKKTKEYIVFREIPFKKGDSLSVSSIRKQLELARQQVYNTTLFEYATIEAVITATSTISVKVDLKERWYIYPVPQFQLVDRNYNDWIQKHNASFDRVNYGIKFVHYNLSGRRDQLRIYLINGYTRNVSITYSNPYSNARLNEGFSVGTGYSQNREIPYATDSNNNSLFYKRSDFVRNNVFASAGYNIRKGLFKKHFFTLGFVHYKVDDSVIYYKNPNYFGERTTSKSIVDLSYIFQYTNVNNVSYPLKGTSFLIALMKRGFGLTGGINMFSAEAWFSNYYPLGKKWFASFQLNGKIKLPFEQAYINQRGLGYGESYLRGLETYVIDGVATALAKATLKRKLLSFNIPFPFFPKVIKKIPFTFFAKTYADLGYSYNKKTNYSRLNNRLLYTGGFGIDILTLYDINLRFEYSFNQLHENGLFLHNQSGF